MSYQEKKDKEKKVEIQQPTVGMRRGPHMMVQGKAVLEHERKDL